MFYLSTQHPALEKDMKEEKSQAGETGELEAAIDERLRSLRVLGERQTSYLKLAREIRSLPRELVLVAVEMSAAIAAISLRASAEFLRSVPAVAGIVTGAAEMRAWAEIGRRLTMGDAEVGTSFFAAGASVLTDVPPSARMLLFEVCAKQMVLSSAFAVETYQRAPQISRAVDDPELLRAVLETAAEVARRSAKHSADFLAVTPQVVEIFRQFEGNDARVARQAIELTRLFAMKAGGVAADVWAALPGALQRLTAEQALALLNRAGDFLSQSGSAALHLLPAGGQILRTLPEVFDEWCELLWVIAEKGNAALVAFVRISAPVFKSLAGSAEKCGGESCAEAARRVIAVTRAVALVDAEAAISCFRSSAQAVHRAASLEHYEQWARGGLESSDDSRARRSYYALETRRSNESLTVGVDGLALETVAPTLSLYIEALTGRAVDIEHFSSSTEEARIGDGRTVHLPARVSEFETEDLNFRLYKVLAAHAAGQIEFGTHVRETEDLRAAYQTLAELYAAENVDARDAFALGGYINDVQNSEAALGPEEEARRAALAMKPLPIDADYRAVLALFPQKALAARIFGTLENGRIDRRLRQAYYGLSRDLDLVRRHLRASRPRIAEVRLPLVPFELLFQITLCGGALDDARQHFGQIVSELETIVSDYLSSPAASVADTLMATSRVYSLFQNITPDAQSSPDSDAPQAAQENEIGEGHDEAQAEGASEQSAPRRDARELFSAWLGSDMTGEPDEFDSAESWTHIEVPEQALGTGEVAFSYDEWDRELSDHRLAWCRVVEKRAATGSAAFVESTRERYRGTISSIRHQFQLMKPENLKRVMGEIDGDDYDLNAVIDYAVDRRANGHQSERLYIKRLRRERDVAVSLLLDQSSSTARTIGRHPLQPYTYPGRRIIEIEKEGLVLMSEALEAVGDAYSINGFTSEGRRNVKFYVVKDFSERYSDEIAQRIGGITYQNNTRLGAAIRHAAARLANQEARTRLLIVLSDGRPYDHDYGDARYAREDTREALRQAKLSGITPFCVTIDRDSEAELRDLYGEVGYTIIDDVLTLPERMPAIYRRLTS